MKRVAIIFPIALTLLGCSNKTLELPEGTLSVGRPVQFQPPELAPFAFDAEGKLVILANVDAWLLRFKERPENVERRIEVRSVDTGATLGSYDMVGEDSYPFMFRHDSAALYCAYKNKITEFDLRTRVSRPIVEGVEFDPIVRNYAQTITVLYGSDESYLALNNHGDVMRTSSQPYFDQYGNAWARSSGGWQMLSLGGPPTSRASPPSYLVPDQAGLRGRMELLTADETMSRKGATAYITAVWLDHSHAKGEKRSALVFAGADVKYAGFVPNRDLIWVATAEGSYLVPFTVGPKPSDDESSP